MPYQNRYLKLESKLKLEKTAAFYESMSKCLKRRY